MYFNSHIPKNDKKLWDYGRLRLWFVVERRGNGWEDKMIDLLQLLRTRVDPVKVKKISGAKGGEWHSPCPLCGGH